MFGSTLALPFITFVLLLGASSAVGQEVRHVGEFHNVSSSDKGAHCSGYSLSLWEHKQSVFGLFDVHEGLCGDPPCGVIRDVDFDAKSGVLSFRALVQGENFGFNGKLQPHVVVGKLNGKPIRLTKEPEASSLDSDKSLPAWCEFWKSVPRCEGVKDMCVLIGDTGGVPADSSPATDTSPRKRTSMRRAIAVSHDARIYAR